MSRWNIKSVLLDIHCLDLFHGIQQQCRVSVRLSTLIHKTLEVYLKDCISKAQFAPVWIWTKTQISHEMKRKFCTIYLRRDDLRTCPWIKKTSVAAFSKRLSQSPCKLCLLLIFFVFMKDLSYFGFISIHTTIQLGGLSWENLCVWLCVQCVQR